MRDKLTDAIRIGIVSSIDPEKCMARVTFQDRGETVSRDLFVLVPFTLKDQAYYMPSVGERVRVIFDPEAPSKGYILGSFYAKNRKPPIMNENKCYVMFEDKTLIEYDKELHMLSIKILGDGACSIDIEAESDVSIKSNGAVNVDSAKEVSIKTKLKVNINADAEVSLNAKGNINIESAKDLTLKGQTSSMTL